MPIIGFNDINHASLTPAMITSSRQALRYSGPETVYTPVPGDRVNLAAFYAESDPTDSCLMAIQDRTTGEKLFQTRVISDSAPGYAWRESVVDFDLTPFAGSVLCLMFMPEHPDGTTNSYFKTSKLRAPSAVADTLTPQLRSDSVSELPQTRPTGWNLSDNCFPAYFNVVNVPTGPTLSGKLKRRNGVPVIDTSGLVITVSTAQGGASIIPASTISTNATGDWTFTNPDALAYATQYWVTIAKADGSETFVGKLSTQADPGV